MTMNQHKRVRVSILISNYNYGHYLEGLLETLLKQTFKDFEIIVSDNGSSDNSSQVLKKYQNLDVRIKVIYNQENIGMTKNWELLRKNATGEFIWFINADDLVESNSFLEKLMSKQKEGDYDVVISSMKKIIQSDSSYEIQKKLHYPFYVKNSVNINYKKALLSLGSYPIIGQYLLRNYADIEFNTNCTESTDFDFLIRYFLKYEPKVAVCNEAVFYFRIHKKNYGYYLPYKRFYNYVNEQKIQLLRIYEEARDKNFARFFIEINLLNVWSIILFYILQSLIKRTISLEESKLLLMSYYNIIREYPRSILLFPLLFFIKTRNLINKII